MNGVFALRAYQPFPCRIYYADTLSKVATQQTIRRRRIMRKFWLVVAAAVMLSGGLAWATDEDTFVSTLKKFGIGPNGSVVDGKRPCFCHGGAHDGEVGTVYTTQDIAFGGFVFDCAVPVFDSSGKVTGSTFCRMAGSSITLVDK